MFLRPKIRSLDAVIAHRFAKTWLGVYWTIQLADSIQHLDKSQLRTASFSCSTHGSTDLYPGMERKPTTKTVTKSREIIWSMWIHSSYQMKICRCWVGLSVNSANYRVSLRYLGVLMSGTCVSEQFRRCSRAPFWAKLETDLYCWAYTSLERKGRKGQRRSNVAQ